MKAPTGSRDAALDEATARSVVARLEKEHGVSRPDGERRLAELVKFLDLAHEMGAAGDERRLVPSVHVDEAWHALILHTRQYMEFCDRRYGEFLHHEVTPPDAEVGPGDVFEYLLTRALMRKRYGELDAHLWPRP